MKRSLTLAVKVVPGSSRDAVSGWLGDELKIKVAAPPEKGRANKAVCRLLAGMFDLPELQVQIVSGHQAAHKLVQIEGLSSAELAARLPPRGDP